MFLISCGYFSKAQYLSSRDHVLSALRGTWEYHTYHDKWTLEFESDTHLLINDTVVNYSIGPGVIQIKSETEETEYRFSLNNDSLTLKYPNGSRITYHHDEPGNEEKLIDGKFYTFIDSLSRHSIKFSDGVKFSVSKRIHDSSTSIRDDVREGLYRVESDNIYLAFNDGTIDTAEILYRDYDGLVDGIVYHRRLYDKEIQSIPPYPPDPYPPYPFPPPPPPPPPLPPPPFPPPDDSVTKNPEKPKDDKRDNGSKRNDNGEEKKKAPERPHGKRPL